MEREILADAENGSVSLSASSSSGTGDGEKMNYCENKSNKDRLVAWLTVFSAVLIQFCGFGYSFAFGVFQDFYVREFLTASTSSQISWIGSIQTFLMLICGVIAGLLFDKGYCYHLVTTGSIILSISLFLLSLARPERYYQVLLTQGIGVGLGGGLIYTPTLAVLAQHFTTPSARARVMGIAVAGCSIGGVVHPILMNQLLHTDDSEGPDGMRRRFIRATLASAGLVAGLLFIALALFRTKYPKETASDVTDEEVKKYAHDSERMKIKTMISKFASDRPYVFLVFGLALFELAFFFPPNYLQLYSIKHGVDPDFAFYILSILNGMSFFGRIIPGFFVNSLGVANILLLATAARSMIQFCMLAVKDSPGITSFAALYGFLTGAYVTLASPMLTLLAESPTEIGARLGVSFAITGFASLTGTPIAGALLTSKYIWWRPIIFGGIACVAGFALLTCCRVLLGKRKGSIWVI